MKLAGFVLGILLRGALFVAWAWAIGRTEHGVAFNIALVVAAVAVLEFLFPRRRVARE